MKIGDRVIIVDATLHGTPSIGVLPRKDSTMNGSTGTIMSKAMGYQWYMSIDRDTGGMYTYGYPVDECEIRLIQPQMMLPFGAEHV